MNENYDGNRIVPFGQHQSASKLSATAACEDRVSNIKRNAASLLSVQLNVAAGAMKEGDRVPIGTTRPSKRTRPQIVAVFMQETSCTIEFAPAKHIACRPRDIDNLSTRKAVSADWAII